METMALVTIVCMSTIAGIAGSAVLIETVNDRKRDNATNATLF